VEAARADDALPQRHDIVVIGASAGGVEALSPIAEGLPDTLRAAVFVVLHTGPGSTGALAGILARAGRLPVSVGVDGAPIRMGTICVAPPDAHLAPEPGVVRVLRGPKVNGHRPAADVLFHSAARAYGRGVVGVVLTGTLYDGTLGLRAIKRRGGAALVQSDAVHQGMPTSAIENVDVDRVIPLQEIPAALTMLTGASEEAETSEHETEATEVESGFDISEQRDAPGSPTVLRCPECNGALWELEDGDLQSYACHVGHVFSADSLLGEQEDAVERAIWSAVRLIPELVPVYPTIARAIDALPPAAWAPDDWRGRSSGSKRGMGTSFSASRVTGARDDRPRVGS
jgi:two-component system chemotaxis response regulator CheB